MTWTGSFFTPFATVRHPQVVGIPTGQTTWRSGGIGMRDIWRRIDTQFATLIPDLLESLGPLAGGASEHDISRLEQTLGFRLPEEVRQSYAIHDGTGGRDLYTAYGLSDLEEIARNWTEMRGLSE